MINTPFDVCAHPHLRGISVVLQTLQHRSSSREYSPLLTLPEYRQSTTGPTPALVTIAREEGARALWKGFVPKVLRLAPGGGVLLLVVEFTLGTFRKSELRTLCTYRIVYGRVPDHVLFCAVLGPPLYLTNLLDNNNAPGSCDDISGTIQGGHRPCRHLLVSLAPSYCSSSHPDDGLLSGNIIFVSASTAHGCKEPASIIKSPKFYTAICGAVQRQHH